MKCAINLMGFQRFDEGTICKIAAECGLVRGNPQWPGVLGCSANPNILIQSLL